MWKRDGTFQAFNRKQNQPTTRPPAARRVYITPTRDEQDDESRYCGPYHDNRDYMCSRASTCKMTVLRFGGTKIHPEQAENDADAEDRLSVISTEFGEDSDTDSFFMLDTYDYRKS